MSNSEIPFYAPRMTGRYADAVAAVIGKGNVGPGPAVAEFAARLSDLYEGLAMIVPTTSGTVALQLAAYALGLRPGDVIICPAYGVVSVPNAFAWMGLRVRFVDIASDGNYNITALGLALLYTRPKAVCNVNFGGSMSASKDVLKLCLAANVPVIDDASCGIAHTLDKRCGLYGSIGVLSFSVPKLITTGQGGAVICQTTEQRDVLRTAIDQGRPWMETIGTNLRMTDMQAALGNAQLDELDVILAVKASIRRHFLDGGVNLLTSLSGPMHYHVVLAENQHEAEALIKRLAAAGIEAKQQYQVNALNHSAFDRAGCGQLAGSQWFRARAVYLPFGLTLTPADVERIAAIAREYAPLTAPAADQGAAPNEAWSPWRTRS